MEHASTREIYSVQATVRTYESGADGLMKPETVLHWFQEIAEAHASCLGFGYDFVTSRSLAWVEVRLDASVNRLPRWKETVELRRAAGAVVRFSLPPDLDGPGNASAGAPQPGNQGCPRQLHCCSKLPVGCH